MNRKIIMTVAILALILGLFFAFKNVSFAPTANTGENENPGAGGGKININPGILGQTLPLSNAPKDVAWAVFQKYLAYNKDRDVEGVRSVVYKIASVCEDPKTRLDCEARMGMAYGYGITLKKEDFVNIWSDEGQIILSTDFKTEEDNYTIRRTRAIIFFIRDQVGLKMLSYSPFKGAVANKGSASKEEFDARIIRWTEDKDQDGMADYHEECLDITEGQSCSKTNPKIRDTDGNGLWDGVQALMK